MFNSSDRIIDRLDPREWGREEPHWVRTAVSTITMAAAVGAAGLAVWRYLQDNPQLFRSDAADVDLDSAAYDGPTAPDVPPPTAN
ncbi:hypothetical protein [Novosphingobium ginsenosidimutans]|uniref:Uncharacterized protein n=1 Tax=Novosphingobium ginsenosidimutans TaxID=1176536 RepID=A0A5B8S4B1_9SPHN|nr:hypothetical protein [Novosphingobium ginsenosidimutans]QEA16396.1 hypothetical protein FRF71_09765 [Novosphingobium ginsenosidimutans]